MGLAIDNLFQSYDLDEHELEQGHTLSAAQIMVIKNLISGYAHEHLNIIYDANQPHLAAIHQARAKGAMEALRHLIDSHNAIINARLDRLNGTTDSSDSKDYQDYQE